MGIGVALPYELASCNRKADESFREIVAIREKVIRLSQQTFSPPLPIFEVADLSRGSSADSSDFKERKDVGSARCQDNIAIRVVAFPRFVVRFPGRSEAADDEEDHEAAIIDHDEETEEK